MYEYTSEPVSTRAEKQYACMKIYHEIIMLGLYKSKNIRRVNSMQPYQHRNTIIPYEIQLDSSTEHSSHSSSEHSGRRNTSSAHDLPPFCSSSSNNLPLRLVIVMTPSFPAAARKKLNALTISASCDAEPALRIEHNAGRAPYTRYIHLHIL